MNAPRFVVEQTDEEAVGLLEVGGFVTIMVLNDTKTSRLVVFAFDSFCVSSQFYDAGRIRSVMMLLATIVMKIKLRLDRDKNDAPFIFFVELITT